eukprot:10528544-Ditylum_brightwellii.AAC.1
MMTTTVKVCQQWLKDNISSMTGATHEHKGNNISTIPEQLEGKESSDDSISTMIEATHVQ